MMRGIVDITGEPFGMLTVLRVKSPQVLPGKIMWVCRCKCGNIYEASAYELSHGIVDNCGCREEAKAGSA